MWIQFYNILVRQEAINEKERINMTNNQINQEVKKAMNNSKSHTTQPNLKLDNFSRIALQDLLAECSPYAPVTPLLTPNNEMYYAIQRVATKETTVQLPYVVSNKVLRLMKKYTRDVSGQVLQSSPYTVIDGMCITAMYMYDRINVQRPPKVRSRVLAQSYLLHTSLCVALSSNGDIRIITASPAILSKLPLHKCNVDAVNARLDLHNDDLCSGVLVCVELIPTITGYDLKPTTVHVGREDIMVLPKLWVDSFLSYVYDILSSNLCRITITNHKGENNSLSASLRKNHSDLSYTITKGYIDNSGGKYGYIRCVNADNNRITVFPITHLVSIHYK